MQPVFPVLKLLSEEQTYLFAVVPEVQLKPFNNEDTETTTIQTEEQLDSAAGKVFCVSRYCILFVMETEKGLLKV